MQRLINLGLLITTMLTSAGALATSTLHIVERPEHESSIDLGATGDSVGDLLVFANELFDSANQRKIGSDQGFCVRTVVGKSWECNFTLTLGDGQLTVHGPFNDLGDSLFAVTGGTGHYAGARGSLTLTHRVEKPPSYDFTLGLR